MQKSGFLCLIFFAMHVLGIDIHEVLLNNALNKDVFSNNEKVSDFRKAYPKMFDQFMNIENKERFDRICSAFDGDFGIDRPKPTHSNPYGVVFEPYEKLKEMARFNRKKFHAIGKIFNLDVTYVEQVVREHEHFLSSFIDARWSALFVKQDDIQGVNSKGGLYYNVDKVPQVWREKIFKAYIDVSFSTEHIGKLKKNFHDYIKTIHLKKYDTLEFLHQQIQEARIYCDQLEKNPISRARIDIIRMKLNLPLHSFEEVTDYCFQTLTNCIKEETLKLKAAFDQLAMQNKNAFYIYELENINIFLSELGVFHDVCDRDKGIVNENNSVVYECFEYMLGFLLEALASQ